MAFFALGQYPLAHITVQMINATKPTENPTSGNQGEIPNESFIKNTTRLSASIIQKMTNADLKRVSPLLKVTLLSCVAFIEGVAGETDSNFPTVWRVIDSVYALLCKSFKSDVAGAGGVTGGCVAEYTAG